MGCSDDFTTQYNMTYITRYNRIKELITTNPCLKESKLSIHDLSENLSNECIVIAILFVDSKNKPSIFNSNQIITENYLEDSQFLIEDSKGRIHLVFSHSFRRLDVFSTGMILGFVGFKNEKNIFICSDIIFPKPVELANKSIKTENSKILFLSNILLNMQNYEKVKMAIDYFSNEVDEIVIFGDLFSRTNNVPDFEDLNQILFDLLVSNKQDNKKMMIHLIPGFNDPTSKVIPTEPIHKMFFRREILNNLNLLEHPSETVISDQKFVFMNNYIIQDLMKYTRGHCTILKVMEQLLKIRCIAPNSPDTLPSAPCNLDDPLKINDCDYFVAGGTPSFGYSFHNGIMLLSIPDFNKTQSVVILDVASKVPEEIYFKLN